MEPTLEGEQLKDTSLMKALLANIRLRWKGLQEKKRSSLFGISEEDRS
jgi:hypothetical protein